MPRPRKRRRVGRAPVHTFYKPQGVPLEELTGLNLPVEGLEAMRLVDAEGLDHAVAAEQMDISRPTLSRILAEARNIVARALSQGWAIHIDGGDYCISDCRPPHAGTGCGRGGRRGCRPENGR